MSKRFALTSFVVIIFALIAQVQEARAQTDDLKFEAGAQFALLSVVRFDRTTEPGVGGRFGYNATRNIAFEAEMNFFPRKSNGASNLSGGRITEGLFGVKAGKRFSRVGVFGKARPGFLSFSRAIVGPNDARQIIVTPQGFNFQFGRLTHFATDIGGAVEFYPSRRTILRFDVGDTVVRYGKQTFIDINGNPTSFRSFTRNNLQFNTGFGFRF